MAWHWIESGEGLGTGFNMTVQDVKVTFSCRSFETMTTFITRKHEDYILDARAFEYPSWKHLVCPVYATKSFRTEQDRGAILARVWPRVPDPIKTRIAEWAQNRGDNYDHLWGIKLTTQ